MPAPPLLGRPMWYELQTPDLEAGEAFYHEVIGWTVSTIPGLPQRYALWLRESGGRVGGGMGFTAEMRAEGVRPQWMLYLGTPSLETTTSLATQLGGTIVSPVIDIVAVGRMRAVRDPQGAIFSLFEPALAPDGPEEPGRIGDVVWLELAARDPGTALGYYQSLFGWRPTEALDMGPIGRYQMFGRRPDHSIGAVMAAPPGAPPAWAMYFRVADVRAAAATATALGGRIVDGPMEVPGGWSLQAVDPQGVPFALFQQA